MTMTPQRQKVDRDEVFLEYTKSVCPVCKTVIDGEVNAKDNRDCSGFGMSRAHRVLSSKHVSRQHSSRPRSGERWLTACTGPLSSSASASANDSASRALSR